MWTLSIYPSRDSGLSPFDIVVRAQPTATVRDFAEELAAHVRPRCPQPYLVPAPAGRPWPAGQLLTECGLRSGDLVSVAPAPASWADRPGTPADNRAVLTVVSGVDCGRTVRLRGDAATIGRDEGCSVRLGDPMVSRRHARILFTGAQPVVVDEGSAGGTLVDGAAVSGPTLVAWDVPITVGATTVVLHPAGDPEGDGLVGGAVLRPPRLGEPLSAETIAVAPPPAKDSPPYMPWAMLLLPLVMGAGLIAGGWNLGGLAIVIGWPVIILVDHCLQKRHAAKRFAAEVAEWRADLDVIVDRLDRHAEAQRERARTDHPPPEELRRRILRHDPGLWQRQPGAADFLFCRVGLGPVPALVTASVGEGGDRNVRAQARAELDRRSVLAEGAVVHDLGGAAVTAITGPREQVDAVARAMVVRLCADHSPVEISMAAIFSPQRSYQETWLRWLPHTLRRSDGRSPVAIGAADGQALLDALIVGEPGHAVTVCLLDEAVGLSRRRVESVVLHARRRRLHLVWLGAGVETAPPSSNAVLDLTLRVPTKETSAMLEAAGVPAGQPKAALAHRERSGVAILSHVDSMDLVDAWQVARAMHACTDDVTVRPADTDLPNLLRLADLSEDFTEIDDPAMVLRRWAAARGLRAQLGLGIDGVVGGAGR